MKLGFFFFLFFFIEFVSSLGISPVEVKIDFKPNLNYSFEVSAVNSPPKNQSAEIYYDLRNLNSESLIHEYENIISFEKDKVSFTSEENIKNIIVYLKFPEGFSKGGIHNLRIGIRPYVETKEGLVIRAGNELEILVNVSEKYVDEKYKVKKELKILDIRAENIKQGEKSDIEILIRSESEVILKEVYAEIKVLRKGDVLRTITTDKISITPGEEKTLNSVFDSGTIAPGQLVIDAEIFYGSNSVKGEGSFSIYSEDTGVMQIEKSEFKFSWIWFFIIFIITLLLIILLLLFFLLRKKRYNENEKLYE